MTEMRRVAAWVIPLAALAVIVVGLWPRQATSVGDDDRAAAIAANLACPFCIGESIASSTSGIARDLRALIAEQVAQGRTDAEIYGFFVASYGEQVLLDPSFAGWGFALWALPLGALCIGVLAVLRLRRSRANEEVAR